MKHRVKRVFERDLDGVLDAIDRDGSELIRIIDLPRGALIASECSSCTDEKLCLDHNGELFRIREMNRTIDNLTLKRDQLMIWLPRYAVVYKEPS